LFSIDSNRWVLIDPTHLQTATLCRGIPWCFRRVTRIFFKDTCVYQENTSYLLDNPWYTMERFCITILNHAIENKLTNIVKAT